MEKITTVLTRLSLKGPDRKEGFVELFVSKRLIQGLATAMLALFMPIFLYETIGEKFWFVGLFFAALSLLYALPLPLAMKLTNKIGFSRALALGAVFSVSQFATLYFMDESNIWYLIWPLAVFIAGFRLFHWVPYHVDFTEFTKGGSRRRDVSLMFATIAFMGVIGPILAGFIISNAGYDTLFLVGVVLLTIAGFSYLFVPAVDEQFTWGYRETFKNLFSDKFKNLRYGEMANGAEIIVTTVAWPIFLYEVLNGEVLEIGALSTVIVGVTIVIQLFVGKYIDKKGNSKVETLKRGSVLSAIGWILKMFVFSTTQIFFVGLYHNITRIFLKTPYSAILYDMSGEQGHYVDEFTVMREMATHFGRAAALVFMVYLTLYLSIEWTFIIGVFASLAVNAIYYAHNN